MTCPLCQDRRHVEVDGVWRRCRCLDRVQRDLRCKTADIPEHLWDVTIESLAAPHPTLRVAQDKLSLIADAIRQQGLKRSICIVSSPKNCRTIGFLLLKAALAQTTGCWTKIDDLTGSYLGKDNMLYQRCRKVGALMLLVGHEPAGNRMNRDVLCALLDDREFAQAGTLIMSVLHPTEMAERYGDRTLWRAAVLLPSQEFGW